MAKWSTRDSFFMRRCLKLARKGEGRVSPNPLVGAVVVRGNRIIGEGCHERFGGPHAEANALRGIDARGATLYVSLEPCSHSCAGKKMPPCVPLVIGSGVKRVVVAAKDANPKVCGLCDLRDAGIRAESGLLAREAEEQNESFFKFMSTGEPFLLVKMVQSSNGKVGIKGKSRVWLSGREFDSYAHRLRNRYDAIAVGINTVLADDPRLTCRIRGGRNPARIVLDSRLQIPLSARVLKDAHKERVIIATSERASHRKFRQLMGMGAIVLVCGKHSVSLRRLLSELPPLGIISVLLEGGATSVREAISQGLADKALVATSPKEIHDDAAIASPFTPAVLRSLKRKRKFQLGPDSVIEGYFKS